MPSGGRAPDTGWARRRLPVMGVLGEELGVGLTFADRLNMVFAAFLQPPNEIGERVEWTNTQVVRAMEHLHGRPICTVGHLRSLRNGSRTKPSVEIASSLARTFEYLSRTEPEPGRASALAAYLVLDPAEGSAEDLDTIRGIHAQLEQAIAVRDSGFQMDSRPQVVGIMARLGDLEDEESLQAVEALVEQLGQEEKSRRGKLRRRK
ncbi:hypothetical protein Psed_6756 (plasmid) [Pseudonocardia dioxanivorans CB1190]|uniref:Uncharacterized protein n=1 Tax=Pseudonocardia dioxanivorans (strain ATCC 55486 / DSM 44775 / JCM 13855 / CB1190) TaxID=675635 RepID=F2L6W5_PSEUX|nr:hypothetical protein Psed_6756 [Pseudonocardia dioxanivorans CB1190]GJF01471.1 hypothetical protein PSD17_04350 [Pseudonocardia sp. D17]